MDIIERPSQKDLRHKEFKDNYTIDKLVQASIKAYTKSLKDFLETDTNIVAKRVLEALYLGDEGKLSLIALRTIITVLISNDSGMMMLSSLSKIISKSILQATSLEQLENKHATLNSYIDKRYKRDMSRKLRAKLKSYYSIFGDTREKFFLEENSSANSIGSLLISILVNSIALVEIIKLDSKCFYQGTKYPTFKPHSYLVKFTDDTKYALLDLDYRAEELIRPTIPPLTEQPEKVTKWFDKLADIKKGRPVNLVKLPKRKQDLKEFKAIMDKSLDISKFIDVHHALECTAFQINTDVYDVMQKVFNNNIEDDEISFYKDEHFAFNPTLIGDLPRRYSVEPDKIIIKSKLGRTVISEKGFELFDLSEDTTALNRYNTIKNDMMAFNEKNLNKALSLMSMFSVCENFKGQDIFFTYQYDTRYRIYPVQQQLNPQSDSKGKALLQMVTDSEPLTERGHYWAKVHGASVYGKDKLPFDDRVKFIDEFTANGNLQLVNNDPIKNYNLWAYTDSPYEFLAFCFEYQKALDNPLHPYKGSVGLDATCSGIQMYSGLLLDKEGAENVNVIGTDRKDIYQEVALEVERLLAKGAYTRMLEYTDSNGKVVSKDLKPLADSFKGKITRDITKRNTMTQPYSVTLRGMQDQLKATFDEMTDKGQKFWNGDNWEASRLLSEVNQRAIDNVVKGASKGKDFIKKITGLVAEKNKGLLYTNKMGGVVYQKNLKSINGTIWSHIWTPARGVERVRFTMQQKSKRVDNKGQQSASAPNLIHSLDTSLLHLTIQKCINRGVKGFWVIHDDYRVHPNKVDILAEEVRNAFVDLFKEGDTLYDWAIQVLSNAGYNYTQISTIFSEIDDPMLGTLDLQNTTLSPYFFS